MGHADNFIKVWIAQTGDEVHTYERLCGRQLDVDQLEPLSREMYEPRAAAGRVGARSVRPVGESSDRLLVDATWAPEGTAKDRLPRGACGRLRGSLRSTRLRTPRVGRCARRLRDPSFPSEDRLPGLLPCRPRTL